MESNTIEGVHIKNITRHRDERGYFSELLKKGERGYHAIEQTSYALTNPGIIKAFHYHDYWESWVVTRGRALIVMHDNRPDSKTKGVTQVLHAGDDEPVVLSIPPGVAHGYKALGSRPVGILYHAEEAYDANRKDQIGTIPHDDVSIGFDWNKDHGN